MFILKPFILIDQEWTKTKPKKTKMRLLGQLVLRSPQTNTIITGRKSIRQANIKQKRSEAWPRPTDKHNYPDKNVDVSRHNRTYCYQYHLIQFNIIEKPKSSKNTMKYTHHDSSTESFLGFKHIFIWTKCDSANDNSKASW